MRISQSVGLNTCRSRKAHEKPEQSKEGNLGLVFSSTKALHLRRQSVVDLLECPLGKAVVDNISTTPFSKRGADFRYGLDGEDFKQ